MKRVLLVEASDAIQRLWIDQLQGKFLTVSALTIKDAKIRFAESPDLDVIVMTTMGISACAEDIPTLALVREFRKTFTKPIIAASSIPEFLEELRKAGCDYQCHRKQDVVELLIKLPDL